MQDKQTNPEDVPDIAADAPMTGENDRLADGQENNTVPNPEKGAYMYVCQDGQHRHYRRCPFCSIQYRPIADTKEQSQFGYNTMESREQWISGICSTVCFNVNLGLDIEFEGETYKPETAISQEWGHSTMYAGTEHGLEFWLSGRGAYYSSESIVAFMNRGGVRHE